ncbi:FAD-dependent monooxygenase [Gracilibacillus suaedae]|uniref:FAD-dependent monooxygenase n=1 Tax=Gracilibacillus suaedae TaxID=2820273 RepID=UPI001ABE842D|nr:FAD-dependent monooxygenase [Gracilibacillus suaedae]
MKKVKTDVVIVGAGPTGLMAANQLNRYQVDYVCLEKQKDRSSFSKAMGIHARSMEMFDLSGFVEKFVARGYPGEGAKMYIGSKKESILGLNQIESRFPFMLVIPQMETEEILERNLEMNGGNINRGEEITTLTVHDGGVNVMVNSHDETIEYEAEYVLACDGAHSKVRELMEVDFVGKGEGKTFFLGDITTSSLDPSMITGYVNVRGATVFFPYADGKFRVVGLDLSIQGMPYKDELTLHELQQRVNYVTSASIKIENANWLTYFGTAHKQVENYKKDRVFFVGDAAHIHNPLGGQGMNLGLQDATNICWKLMAVLEGCADQSLLQTYDQERRPIAKHIIQQTSRLLQFISLEGTKGKLRNNVSKWLLSNSHFQQNIAETLSHIKYDYHTTSSSQNLADDKLTKKCIQPGARTPDVKFLLGGSPDRRLYHLLRQYPFVCFVYMERQTEDIIDNVDLFIEELCTKYGDLITTFLVVKGGVPPIERDKFDIIHDVFREVENKLTMNHGHTMLIRPDAHVALHISEFDPLDTVKRINSFFHFS